VEPLAVAGGGQSKAPQRAPSAKGRGYTELFIEEDGEAREDKGEEIGGVNEGLSPQVGGGGGLQSPGS